MKNLISITLGIVLAVSLAACGTAAPGKSSTQNPTAAPTSAPTPVPTVAPTSTDTAAQIPNPFVDCKTLDDAAKLAGFTLTVPGKMPEGYSQTIIQAIQNDLIQVGYSSGEYKIVIRKGKGSDDISGDYNEYKENNTLAVGKLQVKVRGDAGKINVATWTDGEYTFAIVCDGMDQAAISGMVSSVQ